MAGKSTTPKKSVHFEELNRTLSDLSKQFEMSAISEMSRQLAKIKEELQSAYLNVDSNPSYTPNADFSNRTPEYRPDRLLRLKEVLKICPVSRSTWFNWVSSSKAPPPIKLGKCTFWKYSDLISFFNSNVSKTK
jgi:predicted DNA-binding transcriptional regulator AlpA